jgi:hypothetical protein
MDRVMRAKVRDKTSIYCYIERELYQGEKERKRQSKSDSHWWQKGGTQSSSVTTVRSRNRAGTSGPGLREGERREREKERKRGSTGSQPWW